MTPVEIYEALREGEDAFDLSLRLGLECDLAKDGVILPEVWAGDAFAKHTYTGITPAEAAQAFASEVDWGLGVDEPWIDAEVQTWRYGYRRDDQGQVVRYQTKLETHTIRVTKKLSQDIIGDIPGFGEIPVGEHLRESRDLLEP